MDAEDESAAYLNYLNDPSTALLSNNVELGDAFPFSEIESSDWQTETFPVLVNSTEDIHLFNGETLVQADNINEPIIVTQTDEGGTEVSNFLQNNAVVTTTDNLTTNTEVGLNGNGINQKTYVNYSPIVKENPDGNKEIYLTEKDINNDASIIQLFNTDGSIITIDKALLSSLNIPSQNGSVIRREIRNYENHYVPVIAYKCKSCSHLFDTEAAVKDHLDNKHPDLFQQNGPISNGTSLLNTNNQASKKYKIYLCSICKAAFSETDLLKQHMIDNHRLEVIQQPSQAKTETIDHKKTLSSLRALIVQQQQKARKKVACSIEGCNLKFPRDDLCKMHEECHVGQNKKQFKCLECDEKFSIWRICSNHLWKCHKIDMGLLNCPMCSNFKSSSSGKVIEHMALHNEERPFLCKNCGKCYKSLVQLRNHEVSHLKSDDNPNKSSERIPAWSTEKWCNLCERYFANAKSLKAHIRGVHEHFKPFICNICGHKTTRKAMLEIHIRQHTGSKPHKCPDCTYRAGDYNCLRKHMMKHDGSWNYKCPHCPYTSIQTSSYKSHIKNKHPGKSGTYNCTICSYTSINYGHFTAHLKKHETTSHQNNILENPVNVQMYTMDVEDDETQTLFNTDQTVEETIDTGGITIPADLDTPNS